MKRQRLPELGPTKRDNTMAVLRGVVGLAPYVGQALAEVIDCVIPNQRIQRIETFLRCLADRLNMLEEGELGLRLRDPERIDLFEDGCLLAARALSDERQQQIATLVADSIADETCDYLESKRVLRLLGELDDAEIIVLGSYLPANWTNDYRRRHAHVLKEPIRGYQRPSIGDSQQEKDRYTAHYAGKLHLFRLGLLKERPEPAGPHGLLREMEISRTSISKNLELSRLGDLLLRRIGVANKATCDKDAT